MNDRIENIYLEALFLDDQNPRLPSYLRGTDDEAIIAYMLREAATLELMLAIGQKGFFRGEPLLVVKENGRYRVVEGNRRLTALKLLRHPTIAPIQNRSDKKIWDEVVFKGDLVDQIPCHIFDSPEPIHEYLGYRHITGVQSWDLTQKAAFLTQRWNSSFPGLPVDQASRELAISIGSRKDYVKRLLVGFQVFDTIRDQQFFRIDGLSETTFYFNYIADSLSRDNIVKFLNVDLDKEHPTSSLDLKALSQWTHWFFEKNSENQTRIKATTEQLRWLNAVIENPDAFDAFANQGKPLKDAYDLTDELGNVFVDCMTKAISYLESADGITHKLPSFYSALDDDLRQIAKLIKKIRAAASEADDEA